MQQGVTKREFVAKLAEVLRMTRLDVIDLGLMETEHGDYVIIKYANGYTRRVDITGDSGIAIIKDVAMYA